MPLSRVPWLQRVLGLVFGLALLGTVGLYADQATYIYDDLGRLSQVIDGQGHVATYSYDAVDNLLSIARNTGGVGAAGSTVAVTLTGTNLTGAALATDNPGIQVRNVVTITGNGSSSTAGLNQTISRAMCR